MTNLEAVQHLRATDPKWAKFSEANLLRRYYEVKRRQKIARQAAEEALARYFEQQDEIKAEEK